MCCGPGVIYGTDTSVQGPVIYNSGLLEIPFYIPSDQSAFLMQYVEKTNLDEVKFLGQTYPPRTLRFLSFMPSTSDRNYFYGMARLDRNVSKAVGEIAFTPLEDFVYA